MIQSVARFQEWMYAYLSVRTSVFVMVLMLRSMDTRYIGGTRGILTTVRRRVGVCSFLCCVRDDRLWDARQCDLNTFKKGSDRAHRRAHLGEAIDLG